MAEPHLHAEKRQKLVTEGSIHKAFFILAGPAVATMSVELILSLTDMLWVGQYGGRLPISIVTSCMFFLWIVWSLVMILDIGVVAVISRYFGMKDFEQASYVGRHAVLYAIIAGTVISIAGILLAPLAFKIMQTPPEVTSGGISYIRTRFIGSVAFVLIDVVAAIFRATGNTRTPMIVSFIVVGLNILLDPLLIFGVGSFPEMGTDGAALASVIASAIGAIFILIFIKAGKLSIPLNFRLLRKFNFKLAFRITKIGTPLAIASVIFSGVYFFLNRVASEFGEIGISALGIGNRCEAVSYFLCFGASMATSAMIGQNLGADKPDRAEKSAWVSLMYTMIFTGIISILFLTIPHLISRIFISDPEVESHVVNYLMILGVSQIFMAAEIILEAAFSGAGDTLPPTIIGVGLSLTRYPLAYYMCFGLDMGLTGLWMAISGTSIIKGIIMVIWFKRGKWKLKQVRG